MFYSDSDEDSLDWNEDYNIPDDFMNYEEDELEFQDNELMEDDEVEIVDEVIFACKHN